MTLGIYSGRILCMAKQDLQSVAAKIITKYTGRPGELLGILEELQKNNENKYLTPEVLEMVAKNLKLPLSRIYSVATFYAFFNLKPQGKHTIVVCRGTACHTRGSRGLLDSLMNTLGFDAGDLEDSGKIFLTTKDKLFTLKTVACFGQCALAPVVEIDGEVYGYMTVRKLQKIIQKIQKSKK
jgi:NADH-quinone oxidoreductase subunit E